MKDRSIIWRVMFWGSWPLLRIIIGGSERTRVLITADNRLLIVCGRISDGRWDLPGGGIKSGEKPVHGAIREVKEETGYSLSSAQLKPLGTFELKSQCIKAKYHFFRTDLAAPFNPHINGVEIGRAVWWPLNETADLKIAATVVKGLELLKV